MDAVGVAETMVLRVVGVGGATLVFEAATGSTVSTVGGLAGVDGVDVGGADKRPVLGGEAEFPPGGLPEEEGVELPSHRSASAVE